MRLLALLLLLTTALATAQPSGLNNPQQARDLALASHKVLNEYAIGAADPEAMKYAQRLRLTQSALDAQYRRWPAPAAGGDMWTPWRVCQSALQQASALAALSARKAISAVNEPDFLAAKTGLQQLRSGCDAQIRRAGTPA